MFGSDRRVVVLALARMADAVANSFLIIVLPLYIASGDLAVPTLSGATVLGYPLTLELLIGFALSLFGFLNSSVQPLTGRLSDRTGRRKVFILFGLAVLAVSAVAYALVDTYRALVVVRAVQGLGGAFVIPTTIALVNDLAHSDAERGGNFGVFNTFRLVGFGFGPIDAAFGVAVLGALVSFSLVLLLVEDPDSPAADAGDELSISIRGDGRGQWLDPVFVLGLGTFFMAVTIALYATLQEPINARLDQGPQWFGIQFAAVVIANVVLQMPIGRAADRVGRKPFLVGGLLLLAPAVLAQGLVTSTLGMLLARTVHGISVAMLFAPALAVAGDLAEEGQSGTTLSVLTMAFGFGTAVGPLASGVLYGYGFVVPFAFGAVLAVAALLLVVTQVEETLEGARRPGLLAGGD
ncbi:MFS transporter [Halobacteriales archaeon QS_1_69_70]|nr:MAG: MFS transporter [Halobacteriales archaeon QS_1_69_70]